MARPQCGPGRDEHCVLRVPPRRRARLPRSARRAARSTATPCSTSATCRPLPIHGQAAPRAPRRFGIATPEKRIVPRALRGERCDEHRRRRRRAATAMRVLNWLSGMMPAAVSSRDREIKDARSTVNGSPHVSGRVDRRECGSDSGGGERVVPDSKHVHESVVARFAETLARLEPPQTAEPNQRRLTLPVPGPESLEVAPQLEPNALPCLPARRNTQSRSDSLLPDAKVAHAPLSEPA